MRSVQFKTLGCRLNQYETDALVTRFHRAGYRVVDYPQSADVTVINTCTVTNQSDQKSRYTIGHAARKNPSGLVVVTGCMANNHREQLESDERITYVIDNARKSQIVSLIDAHFRGEMVHPNTHSGDVFGFDAVDKGLHTRTSIKVQDGCDNFCTYCIVPAVRGKAVSRPTSQILEDVRRVVDNGFKEIVITGVNLGRYAWEEHRIEDVIERVAELPGEFRIRISSMEPDGFGPDFHKLFMHPRLTPHLHLCLQSGSDKILRNMRRMYTTSSFMEIVERFRREIPDFNFSTDVIVGFPGESEDDFMKTAELVCSGRFSHVHTFRYSRRKGTRADRMEGQIEEKVKTARSEIIRQISRENRLRHMESMTGKTQRVLVEKVDKRGMASGYGEHYLPVLFPASGTRRNEFRRVLIRGVRNSGNPYLNATLM